MFKRVIMTLTILTAIFAVCAFAEAPFFGGVQQEAFAAASVVDSGTCGARAEWVLDSDCTLTISGTGAMTNWAAAENSTGAPWVAHSASIKSVVIEKGIVSISENAFYNCTALENITIGESVTSINLDTLRSCTALKNITVSENNTSFSDVDGVLFNKNASVLLRFTKTDASSYTIPNGVKEIGDYAFANCENLNEIVISQEVAAVRDYAFYNCNNVISISIPDSVTYIGNHTFENCTGLSYLTIGKNVESIGDAAHHDLLLPSRYNQYQYQDLKHNAFFIPPLSLLTNCF